MDLKATGENFYKDVEFIKKKLIGRKYNETTKLWEIPIIQANIKILEKAKKSFADHDALWAFEEEDFETYLTVEKEGDYIHLKSYYDAKLVEIIKAKKSKGDKWDGKIWVLKEETWKAIKQDIISYLKQTKEKYHISI